MMPMLRKVGVHLDARSARAVALGGWSGTSVRSFEEARGEGADGDELALCLERLAQRLPSTRRITLALPDDVALTRLLSLPPMPRKEWPEAVRWKSELWLRGQDHDFTIAWQLVSSTDDGAVLVVTMARTDQVARVVEAAEVAGLAVEAVLPATVALLQTYEKLGATPAQGPRVIADAGPSGLTLWLYLDGRPAAHRYLNLAPHIEAGDDDGRAALELIARELRYFAGACADRHPRARIDAVTLWGDRADEVTAAELQDRLEIAVERLDLSGSLGASGRRFAVAAGAAWSAT